jgi:hypothetical protein
VEAEAVEEEA